MKNGWRLCNNSMHLRLTFALTISGTAAGILWAQSVPPLPGRQSLAESRSIPASAQTAPAKTQWEEFRQLLAMSGPDREKVLAGKPAQLRAILKEYDSLSPGDREIRLRMAELRYYLMPLMAASPANRASLLAKVPAKDRKAVEDRLAKWNRLAPELQKEVLENEWMITAIMRYGAAGSSQPIAAAEWLPTERRRQIDESRAAFQQLSGEKRDRMIENFSQVLGMDEKEKTKALNQVPTTERQKMAPMLQDFQKLAPSERPEVIKSLKEFAAMSPLQQAQFFENAEKWNHLSEAEKNSYRRLIVQMPPLPPGLELPPMPFDPGNQLPLTGELTNKR
jgi:hypothetical protein